MPAGRSTISNDVPLHFRQLKNVHYDGGVPWMLIPDDEGVLHLAILTEISPPVTRDVAEDIQLNLYTKYVLVCFQVFKVKLNDCWGKRGMSRKLLSPCLVSQSVFEMGIFRIQVKTLGPACSVLATAI
jgi:hypothetical protein